MKGMDYTILAYALGLTMLWVYAAIVWMTGRSLARREQRQRGEIR